MNDTLLLNSLSVSVPGMELDEAMALVVAVAGGPVREPDPKALEQLYASLPKMRCIGQCASSCGVVELTPLERARIERRGIDWVDGVAVELPDGQHLSTTCSALDQARLVCRVYQDRPMVCRIWGLIEALACPYGCVPEGGYLDDLEGLRLMNLSLWYGGAATAVDPAKWDALVAIPGVPEQLLAGVTKPVKEDTRIVQATIRVRPAV